MLWDHIYSQGDAGVTSGVYRAAGKEAYHQLPERLGKRGHAGSPAVPHPETPSSNGTTVPLGCLWQLEPWQSTPRGLAPQRGMSCLCLLGLLQLPLLPAPHPYSVSPGLSELPGRTAPSAFNFFPPKDATCLFPSIGA